MKIEQFNEILNQLQGLDNDAIFDTLQAMKQTMHQIYTDAVAETRAAYDAYFADARIKEEMMKGRIAELVKSRDALQKEIEGLKQPLVAATVRQDSDKLSEVKAIKDRIRDLEEDKQIVNDELGLLKGAHITRDPDLYNDAVGKHTAFLDVRDEYRNALSSLSAFVEKQEDICRIIREHIRSARMASEHDGRIPQIKELYKHYYSEELAALPPFDLLAGDDVFVREIATKSPRFL